MTFDELLAKLKALVAEAQAPVVSPAATPVPAPAPAPATTYLDLATYFRFPTGTVSFPERGSARLSIKNGDHATWDATCDFAGLSGTKFPSGSVAHLDFNLRVEAGSAMVGEWVIAGEIHNDDNALGRATSPPFSIHLDKDRMSVVAIKGGATRADDQWLWLWKDASLLQRGRDYHFTIEAKFTPAGYLKVWRDGVLIVNYTGGLGYGAPTYWMPDLYRSASTETLSVVYSKMLAWVS